ncbi:hypothetical protein [Tautonia plasticadhaerens]|uniref:Uncharacterized protein n=1 Tax=Tautonia plasticadhaerens TaxID=2527974 RepID=A0A518H720_9BACT|nr:hypothetical protein [Tautonia plasticadhaerens]QDV36571.1 hypothetical protein ElP_44990 [Tautonia plasticadhaerens]
MDQDEAPAPAPGPERFEFAEEHGRLIGDLGTKMHFVGLLTTILGVVALLSGLLSRPEEGLTGASVVSILSALFLGAVGFWSMRSGREFVLVSRTEGADIPHLMRALQNLRRLFGLQYVLAWIGLILLVVAILFGYFVDQAH